MSLQKRAKKKKIRFILCQSFRKGSDLSIFTHLEETSSYQPLATIEKEMINLPKRKLKISDFYTFLKLCHLTIELLNLHSVILPR